MKKVVRKTLKLDLPYVLEFIAAAFSGVGSSILLPEIQRHFGCKRRAAQDALSILVKGGWVERRSDPDDSRRKNYYVTEKGEHALESFDGWYDLRLARWRYSTTSTRARTRRLKPRSTLAPVRWISVYARNVQRDVALARLGDVGAGREPNNPDSTFGARTHAVRQRD